MKKKFSIIALTLFSVFYFSQNTEKLNDHKAAEFFKTHYKKKIYKKFEGKMMVQNHVISFDNKTIYYDKNDKIVATILKQGLIYPQLLTDYQMQKFLDETTDKTQKRFLKMQKDPKASFDVNNIELSNFSEISTGKLNNKVRRFKVNLRDNRLNTHSIYYFELTNDNATENLSLENFVLGSKLTYIGN